MIKLSQSLVTLQNNAPVHIEVRCVQPSTIVGVDVRVSTGDSEPARDVIVYAQRWVCKTPHVVHRRTVRLRLPGYLAYRPDHHNRYNENNNNNNKGERSCIAVNGNPSHS